MEFSVVPFCFQNIVIEFHLMVGIFDPLPLEINTQSHMFDCACCYFVKFEKPFFFFLMICQWPATVTKWPMGRDSNYTDLHVEEGTSKQTMYEPDL